MNAFRFFVYDRVKYLLPKVPGLVTTSENQAGNKGRGMVLSNIAVASKISTTSCSLSAIALMLFMAAPANAQTNAAPEATQSAPPASGGDQSPTDTPGMIDGPSDALPPSADAAAQGGADIVVTASRAGRAGFEAPTPTTVLDAGDLAKTGATNPADLLNRSPAFSASITPASTSSNTTNVPGANFLNLRGLGTSRTLVLVDGHRHVPTSSSGTIDVNLVPSILIDRIEVVTGGASAAWGSDAVSGVVNFILNHQLDGLRANAQAGISSHGDQEQFLVQGAYGAGFLDDRLRITVAGEYYDNRGGKTQGSRDWGRDGWNLVSNPDYTPTNGQFARIVSPDVQYPNATMGGLITARTGPLANIQFGPGGTVLPFTYGTHVGTTFMIGGSGDNLSRYASLEPEQDRWSAYGRVSFEITPDITAAVDVTVARTHAISVSTPPTDYGNITIQQDNAYLPDEIRAIMVDNNIQNFRMGRLNYEELGNIRTDNTTKLQRYVASLEGKFGDSWKWGAYFEHGIADYRQVYLDNRNQANWRMGVDAVVDPATGQIVCRSTLTDPANGCVPINVFGVGSISDAARDYVLADPYSDTRSKQDAGGVNISGEPFELWAGPVSIAAGVEARKQSLRTVSDPLSQAGAYRIGNVRAISGSFNVKEAFGEIIVPLARDLSFARLLEFNGAIRRTDYSISGAVTSWKAGLTYEPVQGVRFRATRSRDIRAPNLTELFLAQRQNTGFSVIDRVTGVQSQVAQLTMGNTDLQPEIGDTWTYGIVFEPDFAPGLRASIDATDIELTDAISTLSPQDTVDRCQAGATELCELIDRDSTGVIRTIRAPFLNLASIRSRSIDGEIDYQLPLSNISENLNGALSFRYLGTYVYDFITSDGTSTIDLAGQTDHVKYKQTVRVTYNNGPLQIFAEDNFIGKAKLSALYSGMEVSDNSIPSRNYVNLSASYELFDGRVQVFGLVNNLFDRDPPIVVSNSVFSLETNAATYDTIGRRFMIGLRLR